ncbi:hypothetical protein C0992_006390, partial [Termitomyces sp. T32_za158]
PLERGLPVHAYDQNNATSSSQTRTALQCSFAVKSEDVSNIEDTINTVESKRRFFTFYDSATEIDFSPEEAFKEGSGMVSSIKSSLEHLQFGNKLRQKVWMRELER